MEVADGFDRKGRIRAEGIGIPKKWVIFVLERLNRKGYYEEKHGYLGNDGR